MNNFLGPYSLDFETIDINVLSNSIGNYLICSLGKDGKYYVLYVGRSDVDLNDRLKDHVNEEQNYKYFFFKYAKSDVDAYNVECKCYHEYGENEKLNNIYHPDKPNGKTYVKCYFCGK